MSGKRDVLVVTIPARNAKPEELRNFREYLIESILRDVVVLEDSMRWSIEELPAVCLELVSAPEEKTEITAEHPMPENEAPQEASIKEEKQHILYRLLEYRKNNGLGSLGDVARQTYSKNITADVLRMVLTGDTTLNIAEWRAIGRALDKLAQRTKAVGNV